MTLAFIPTSTSQAVMPPERMMTSASELTSMTPAELQAAIDSTWGEGLSTTRKLEIFDTFWNAIDQTYAGFNGIEQVDWTALRNQYRPEVAAGVSRGRFAGIMNALALQLQDTHAFAADLTVNFRTPPAPGIPLLWTGPWMSNTFGACTTAMDDGSALIYQVAPNHPLGLQPGDRVLGFDGHPWSELYPGLLQQGLPLYLNNINGGGVARGSTAASINHIWTASGPMNWHLYDTIDVVKHSTGSVVHLSTAPLASLPNAGQCTEQLDISGVSKPLWRQTTPRNAVSWGIMPGTRIGYIYVWGWSGDAGTKFTQAIEELTQNQQTDGLIVDFRYVEGGNLFLSYPGLGMLFDGPRATIRFDVRKYPDEHFTLKPGFDAQPSYYVVDNDGDSRSYDKPIAVLTGPGAVSSGDDVALFMTYHPRVRTFGKPTNGGFGAPDAVSLDPDWVGLVNDYEGHRVNTPHSYLTHTGFPVDQAVWLTPDDVAAGHDTVVDAAVNWINNGG
ncbi:S41 family peptidase [Kribbella sp. NPDC004536]|uniref:S41 family peptidase n=1 Tax=Kribbella sp. NPDC004536 TaxID=3364106 RepID=UPI00369E6616